LISYDFDYYKPTSIREALELYQNLTTRGRRPIYFAGGTEIITLGRLDYIQTDAVIDIKGIFECNVWGFNNNKLIIGATLPLSILEDQPYFPLLAQTASGVADYTSRNKITIGGNICGEIFYREAVLPFLLADSDVIVAGEKGVRRIPIRTIFNQKLNLEFGEFLVQVETEVKYVSSPFQSVKKRQQWETGYPLITVASLRNEGFLRFAFSGVCSFPFRSDDMEQVLNDRSMSYEDRIIKSFHYLPRPILSDIEGSDEYRLFVLKNTLIDFLKTLEGMPENE